VALFNIYSSLYKGTVRRTYCSKSAADQRHKNILETMPLRHPRGGAPWSKANPCPFPAVQANREQPQLEDPLSLRLARHAYARHPLLSSTSYVPASPTCHTVAINTIRRLCSSSIFCISRRRDGNREEWGSLLYVQKLRHQ